MPNSMEEEHSKLWRLALVIALLALVAAWYYQSPAFRNAVNEKCPWIKEQLAKAGIEFVDGATAQGKPSVAFPSEKEPSYPVNRAAAEHLARNGPSSVDLYKLASDATRWPKTVKINHTVAFPAVVDGKEVGKVNVPAGTELKVVRIAAGKLGLVYNGGGAWVQPEETDIDDRVPSTPPPPVPVK